MKSNRMGTEMFGKQESTSEFLETAKRQADELAKLSGEIKALRLEKDQTLDLISLRKSVEDLKLEKGRLVEENDRKIRETEHRVGLLRKQQEQDVANTKRETTLTVREENLSKDQERFKAEMEFQRTHLQQEIDRIDDILKKVLERLPNVEATFTATRKAAG